MDTFKGTVKNGQIFSIQSLTNAATSFTSASGTFLHLFSFPLVNYLKQQLIMYTQNQPSTFTQISIMQLIMQLEHCCFYNICARALNYAIYCLSLCSSSETLKKKKKTISTSLQDLLRLYEVTFSFF
jgi:hypothetical protein